MTKVNSNTLTVRYQSYIDLFCADLECNAPVIVEGCVYKTDMHDTNR